MIKPIPKKLLPNSVTYKKYLEDIGEGSSLATPLTLNNVKIDEQKVLIRGLGGVEVVGNATLFYDLTNSSGLTDVPINESKITFDGKEYTIKDVDILRENSDIPHHYEILLK